MDLSVVPEIGPSFAAKLYQAGIQDVEMLAGHEDIALLAETTGIDAPRLESFRDAARGCIERALAEAGVAEPAELAWADVDALAARTGLSRDTLARYQDAAQAAVARALAQAGYADDAALVAIELEDAVMKTGIGAANLARLRDAARERLASRERWRVVLAEDVPFARVELRSTHADVAVLVATADEEDMAALARTAGDAVLLRGAAEVATARIGGELQRDLPIYRMRRAAGGEPEEVRIRVAAVVEVAADAQPSAKRGFRFFGRKK